MDPNETKMDKETLKKCPHVLEERSYFENINFVDNSEINVPGVMRPQ